MTWIKICGITKSKTPMPRWTGRECAGFVFYEKIHGDHGGDRESIVADLPLKLE